MYDLHFVWYQRSRDNAIFKTVTPKLNGDDIQFEDDKTERKVRKLLSATKKELVDTVKQIMKERGLLESLSNGVTGADHIIKCALANATDKNKFAVFAKILRDSGLDPNFSSSMTDGYRSGMTFSEWAGYQVSDNNWNDHIRHLNLDDAFTTFVGLAKQKGIYADNHPIGIIE